MSKITCQKCGGEISNDFGVTLSFCTNCGASIQSLPGSEKTLSFSGEPTVVSPVRVQNIGAASNQKTGRYFLGCLGLLFGGVILSAVGIFGYWQWTEKNSVSPEYFGKIYPPKAQTVRFMTASTVDPDSLDPQFSGYSESAITNALFDTLVEYDSQAADLKPSLAIGWERNADATVWTFRLRREAKWTDGKPITANDFVYSWRRALNNLTFSTYADLFFVIKNAENFNLNKAKAEDVGIRAIDDYTLEVTMEKPTPYFVKLLVNSVFRPVPEHGIGKYGKDWTIINKGKLVTSGAFRLAEWSPGEQIVLERNPQFWDNANTKLDKIIFPSPVKKSFGSSEPINSVELYEKGEIEGTEVTNSPNESLKNKKDYHRAKRNGIEFISVNTTVKPFDDVRVRRALSLAIDREKLKEKNLSDFPTVSFVPEIKGYENAKGANFNPNEARKLLTEAGFPNGTGFPEIEYICNTTDKNRTVAEFVQEQWQKELGVKVKIITMEFREFLKRRTALDFRGAARSGWIGDYADPYTFLGLLGAEKNDSGWNDKKYAEMLEKANAEADEKKRYHLLNEAETYLLEQQPVIPLSVYASGMLCKPYIKNLAPNALDYINWREVYVDQNVTAKSF